MSDNPLLQKILSLSKEDRNNYTEGVQYYKSFIKKVEREHNKLSAVSSIQGHFNRNQKIENNVSCKKGCSFCCYQPVDTTKEEIDIIFEEENPIIDRELLKKQAGLNNEEYAKLNYEFKQCIFLKNNECSVYNNRPLVCRDYLVLTDPEFCDTVKYPEYKYIGFVFDFHCLTIMSAMLDYSNNKGLLHNLVHKHLL